MNANGLPLTDTRPENGAPAESPELPGRGGASIGSVAKAVARELVSDLVEFAVDVAYDRPRRAKTYAPALGSPARWLPSTDAPPSHTSCI